MMHCSMLARLAASLLALVVMLAPASALAQDEKPQVIASFSVLADIASRVAGDAATVTALMPLGANPHSYTPSAQDVARLSDADHVLVAGVNYEQSLLPIVEEAAGDRMTVVSQCVPIRPISAAPGDSKAGAESIISQGVESGAWAERCAAHQTELQAAFGDGATAGGAILGPLYALPCGQDHETADESSGDEHAHEAGSCDPHVWTDPANAARWALMIRDTLSELDPLAADTYAANASAYLMELAALDSELRALMDSIPAGRRAIVTNHAALGYFAARYGLTQAGVVIPGGSTTSEPSVRDVLTLIETIQQQGVPAIFTETTASDATAAQIAAEAGVKLVPLYTGSLSQSGDGAATYLDYMRFNANAIADALR